MSLITPCGAHGAPTPTTVDDACARAVAVLQSDSHGRDTPALLSRLREDILSAMVAALCDNRVALRISRLSLLRALWTLPSLRTSITLAFARSNCLSNSSHISDHRPLSTLEEHNINLLVEELSYLMAVDARDTAKSADQRLRALSTRATDLVRLLCNPQSSAFNALNLLVTCARAIQQIGSPASIRVNQRLVSHVLLHLRQHQSYIRVSQLLAVLQSELPFTSSQHSLLESILETYVSQSLPSTAIISLLRGLLSYTSKHVNSDLRADKCIQFILYILQNPPDDVLSDAIAAIELNMHDSFHNLHPRFVRAFSALVCPDQPALQIGGLSLRVTSSHITILFALLNVSRDETVQADFTSSLDPIFASAVAFDTSLLPSSASAGAPSIGAARKAVITNCLRHPATRVRSEVVLQYLQSLLWRRGSFESVALDAMYEAFASIPPCRPSFLKTMFTTLVDKYSPVHVLKAYAFIFETLAESNHLSFAFAECKDILSEGLQQMAHVPPVVATRVIPSFVKISIGIPSLVDPILVFLRKLAASRAQIHQRVACAGFIAILSHNPAASHAVTEASDNLADIIDVARIPVRTSAILRILRFISVHYSLYNRVSHLIQRAVVQLFPKQELGPTEKITPSGTENSSTPQLSLLGLIVKEGDKLALKTPAPHLLRLCMSVHSKCSEASEMLRRYVIYLGNWRGGLLDAVSNSKTDIPVSTRIILLCALLRPICLFQGKIGDEDYPPISTESHWKIYGMALVVRDSLKAREGSCGIAVSDDKVLELPQPEDMTAREGIAARVESERLEDVHGHDNVSLHVWVRALERVDCYSGTGVFERTVQSEFLDGVCLALEETFTASSIVRAGEQEVDVWCTPLVECVCRAFVHSSPWECESKNGNRSSSPPIVPPGEDVMSSSMNTVITMSDCQTASTNGDRPVIFDQNHSNDFFFLNELDLENEDVKKALSVNRLPKLENAARISVRESCLKISYILVSRKIVTDTWSFVRQLCEGCLSRPNNGLEQCSLSSAEERETCTAVEEDNCVGAVRAATKLFQQEFSCSMTVGLTSLYLSLIEVLLEQLVGSGRSDDGVKGEVSKTILGILREYSVQHLLLMRQMVKVLLKALKIDESIVFGIGLLDWLGNHTALVDSQYCGEDDARENIFGVFDPDIVEEAILLNDNSASPVENNLCVIDRIGTDSRDTTDSNGDDGDQGRPGMIGEKNGVVSIIQSLCLNETTEGAVASICCIFSLFSDVLPNTLKCLKGNFLEIDISELSRAQKIAEGLSTFVKGQFVDGCVGDHSSSEKLHGSSLTLGLCPPRQNRKRRIFSWPLSLEKGFGTVVFGLMDVADMELRVLAGELGAEANWSWQKMNSIAFSCIPLVRVLYEEPNTLAIIGRMRGELRLPWSVQEKVEYSASLFFKRWNVWNKSRCAVRPKDNRQRESRRQRQSEPQDDLSVLANLVDKLLVGNNGDGSKRKRPKEWWDQQLERAKERKSNDETSSGIGEDHGESRFMRVSKRSRIRSRNNYIDKVMLEDGERESFADLEDFVVEMGDEVT